MKRWEKVAAVGSQFDADMVEAEGLWGSELLDARNLLREAIDRLWISIQMYADEHLDPDRVLEPETHKSAFADVFRGSSEDPLGKMIQGAIVGFRRSVAEEIEAIARFRVSPPRWRLVLLGMTPRPASPRLRRS